jgi:DNA-binding transcriptional regulator YdaS (Cro superfamily)
MDIVRNEPLERAIELAGGITKMAAALGLNSHSVVHQWRLNRVPAEQCPEIEKLTEGAVRCEELRPDVSWEVLRDSEKAQSGSAVPL